MHCNDETNYLVETVVYHHRRGGWPWSWGAVAVAVDPLLGKLHVHLGELDVLLGHVKMGEEDLLLEDGKPFFVLEVISVQLVVGLQVMVTTFVLNQFVEKIAFVLKHSSEEIA